MSISTRTPEIKTVHSQYQLKTHPSFPKNSYDLIKWIIENPKNGLQGLKTGTDVTEPLDTAQRHATIFEKTTVMLLKVKFLQDLRMLRNSSGHHPRLKGTLVLKRLKDSPTVELEKLINIIDSQAKQLHEIIREERPSVWSIFITAGFPPKTDFDSLGTGSRSQEQRDFASIYRHWIAVPGAIAIIRDLTLPESCSAELKGKWQVPG
ncbi:hypothetical protein IWX49DRAFT_554912 [Phyllosticta citricarpa]